MSTKLTLNEINKQLEKKDLPAEIKQLLKDKKNAISNDKTVKK